MNPREMILSGILIACFVVMLIVDYVHGPFHSKHDL